MSRWMSSESFQMDRNSSALKSGASCLHKMIWLNTVPKLEGPARFSVLLSMFCFSRIQRTEKSQKTKGLRKKIYKPRETNKYVHRQNNKTKQSIYKKSYHVPYQSIATAPTLVSSSSRRTSSIYSNCIDAIADWAPTWPLDLIYRVILDSPSLYGDIFLFPSPSSWLLPVSESAQEAIYSLLKHLYIKRVVPMIDREWATVTRINRLAVRYSSWP